MSQPPPTDEPCPHCKTPMGLLEIEYTRPGLELRRLGCPRCGCSVRVEIDAQGKTKIVNVN